MHKIITPTAKREIEAALKPVLESHGLKITSLSSKDGYSLDIQVCVTDEQGAAITQDRLDFERFANAYDLKPEHYGKIFVSRGTQYRIKGVNPNAPNYPINVERVKDGKGFRMPAMMVTMALGEKQKVA